nr:hypothetical protein TorRG33x02_207520 [Ipomoea trifida]
MSSNAGKVEAVRALRREYGRALPGFHLTLERRRLDLRIEKAEGERGEDGLERWKNLGLLDWSFGLSGTEDGGGVTVVRQRRPDVETG